jgi:FKBP-type peptidyl-prolyl cis-trans isomerase
MFLAVSVATSVGIYYLVSREEKQAAKNQTSAEIQQAIDDLKVNEASPTPADANNEGAETVDPNQPKLEGTKLAGFDPVVQVAEIQTIDTVVGTGAEVATGSTVTAHYTGALAKDGTIFQSSKDTGQPFTSPLNRLIQGWQVGMPGMKAGGTRRILIPAAQAYGAEERPGIPANSDLVFDIELISVQ